MKVSETAYSLWLQITGIAQKLPEKVIEYWKVWPCQWLETGLCFSKLHLHLQVKKLWGETLHGSNSGTGNVRSRSLSIQHCAVNVLSLHPWINYVSVQSHFLAIEFSQMFSNSSRSEWQFCNGKVLVTKRREPICGELLQYPGVPGVSFQTWGRDCLG